VKATVGGFLGYLQRNATQRAISDAYPVLTATKAMPQGYRTSYAPPDVGNAIKALTLGNASAYGF
jgi:hypothetical protein